MQQEGEGVLQEEREGVLQEERKRRDKGMNTR